MKRSNMWRTLLLVIFLCLLPVCNVRASGQEIHSIDISVKLNQDGSADITEVWDVSVDSGTEWYLVQGNLGKIEIRNFSVSDETGLVYENEGRWDVDRSLEEKAGKCGIVDKGNGDYELCFGVGTYGDHVFTVSYRMTNFVKGFKDYCGFNQRFINDGLSSSSERISVRIEKPGTPFTSEDVSVWAFGFDGTIYVTDGAVVAQSNSRVYTDNYVNIMCRFPRDMFDTPNTVRGSFNSMKDRAFEDSEYENSGMTRTGAMLVRIWKLLLMGLGVAAVVLAVMGHMKAAASVPGTFEESMELYRKWENKGMKNKLLFWILSAFLFILFPPFGFFYFLPNVSKKMTFKNYSPPPSGKICTVSEVKADTSRNASYYRDIPLGGHISEIHAALKLTGLNGSTNDVIGAYLLHWLQRGNIQLMNTAKAGFGGRMGKEMPSIVLRQRPEEGEWIEKQLFDLLAKASGRDGILQEKELYGWAKGHYEEVQQILRDIFGDGRGSMVRKSYMYSYYTPSFFNMKLKQLEGFTVAGKQEMRKLYGFKNYLKDFTLMQERQPLDVALWDDYLVAAQLYGMADKVAQTFRRLYPAHFDSPESCYWNQDMDMFAAISFVSAISNAGASGAQRGADAASAASDGGGGFASSGGGGGFSGGGSGGGSR